MPSDLQEIMPDLDENPKTVPEPGGDGDPDREKDAGEAGVKDGGYYYDDAHGYEDFDPDTASEGDEA